MDVLGALAASSTGRTSAELARQCAISTSTCALVLGELERGGWVARYDDRRYGLGSGLFGLVRGLRFPIDPPFGLVAMAWRDDAAVDRWLRGVTPRLTRADIDQYRQVLADVRARGYGAWRFDDAHTSLHERVAGILASLEPTATVARQLTNLMTMVTLRSITTTLEKNLPATEFVVLPIFGRTGQPEHQIEIHLRRPDALTLDELNTVLADAQNELTPGASAH